MQNNAPKTEGKLEEKMPAMGVDFVFEQNPMLETIGTKEQYAEYLATVFPQSRLKEIFYHGGDEKRDGFEKREGGIFFVSGKDIEYALNYAGGNKEHLAAVVLDARNPHSVPQLSRSLLAVDYKEAIERSGANALVGEESLGIVNRNNQNFLARGKSIAVLAPEQIHVLGTADDMEKFKGFVAGKAASGGSHVAA